MDTTNEKLLEGWGDEYILECDMSLTWNLWLVRQCWGWSVGQMGFPVMVHYSLKH